MPVVAALVLFTLARLAKAVQLAVALGPQRCSWNAASLVDLSAHLTSSFVVAGTVTEAMAGAAGTGSGGGGRGDGRGGGGRGGEA